MFFTKFLCIAPGSFPQIDVESTKSDYDEKMEKQIEAWVRLCDLLIFYEHFEIYLIVCI